MQATQTKEMAIAKKEAALTKLMLNIASLSATLTLGLAAGIALMHGLEWRNKAVLTAEQYLFVQQHLYQGFGDRAGPIEAVAIISLVIATLILFRTRRSAFALSLVSLVAAAAGLALFFFGNDPVNAVVRTWTLDSMPTDWQAFRDQWEWSHAIRATLYATSLAAFCIAILLRTSNSSDDGKPDRSAA